MTPERGPARRGGGPKGLTYEALMARKDWKPLPEIAILQGAADFLKGRIVARFTEELFGDGVREVRRFQCGPGERGASDVALAAVLDELRTPSFFSPHRLVVVENGGPFLVANAEDILPFVERGFSGGHLVVTVDGKLDGRTKIAKALAQGAWVVDCPQPFDRPPPWETRAPIWQSDLSRWVVAAAREKGLEIDLRTAFALHERAGTDLAVLAEEIEKMAIYLASRRSHRIDEATISAVVGDLHENSVFSAVDLFLEGRRAEAYDALLRMLERGVSTDRSAPTFEPISIALLFIGAVIPKLRALRRAHALSAEGGGPDAWMAAGLVGRPFILRFQRQLAGMPPRRIDAAFRRLYELDRAIKSGGLAARLLEVFFLEGAAREAEARGGGGREAARNEKLPRRSLGL